MDLRPKYIRQVDKTLEQTKELLVCKLENSQNKLRCEIYDSYVLVKYNRDLHRIWSPQINITFRELEDGTKVRGSIGPSGEIWLVFIFFYFLFALIFVGALLYALSQISLGHSSSLFLYISIFGLIALIGMYLVSYFGQYKSKKQIEYLYSWIENSLDGKH